jgi:hypothetical protein
VKKQQQQQVHAFPPLGAALLVRLWGLVNVAAAFDYFFVSVLIGNNPCVVRQTAKPTTP